MGQKGCGPSAKLQDPKAILVVLDVTRCRLQVQGCQVQVARNGVPLRDLAGQDGSPFSLAVSSSEHRCIAQF